MRRWRVVAGQVDGQGRDPGRVADGRFQLGQSVLVAAGAENRHPRLGEFFRAAQTDAAGCARDDCDLHLTHPLCQLSSDPMLEDLARVVLGQRIPDDHLFGSLEFRDALALQQREQVGDVRSRLACGHDHRTCPLAGSVVGQPDDRDFGDAGVVGEHVLDLLGRDVLAVADDDVLGPAGDDEIRPRIGPSAPRSPVRKNPAASNDSASSSGCR